jgi:predicted nucleotidyltransferase
VDLRLRALTQLDQHAVPLPHGTEVTTRVERVAGERVIPQGTIGRVTRIDKGSLEITFVGLGTFPYARSEVAPRREGQLKYAVRRESAWNALHPCVVLRTTVGSRAWGLADESSDHDLRGAFAHPLAWTSGVVSPPEDLVSDNGSETYWAVDKVVKQALRADPNTLEMLFLPNARAEDEIGAWILAERDAFVSTEIYGTFGRYAIGQLRRLEQGMRLAEHRELLVAWLREDPTQSLDALALRLAASFKRPNVAEQDQAHQAKQYIKQLYRSLADQGLLAASDFVSLVKFATEHAAQFELPRELRPKNAYNMIRLLATGAQWLRDGEPQFEMTGAMRESLLSIKRGEVVLSEVLAQAEALAPSLEEAARVSRLPKRPDVSRADALLRRVGSELARRHVHQTSDPFGAHAPLPPEIVWNE